MTEVLAVEGVSKRFGSVVASDAVSLQLGAGEIHALIGPNGAGKSTLIKQIAGELAPDAGEVRLMGLDLAGMSPAARARAGLARSFQVSSVAPDFTVLQNVMLAVQGRSHGVFRFFRPALRDTALTGPAEVLIGRVGLAGRVRVLASELSHGERRRLEIAMALALKPNAFLLDEPMAGMGAEGTAELTGLLDDLRHEAPILLVEHDMDAVFRLADRITVLSYGRVLASGTVDEVRADAQVQEAYLGSGPMSLLDVRGITAAHGHVEVLFGVDLAMGEGEVVALMGRNGMGKTTTIRCICRMMAVTGGEISYAGQRLDGLASHKAVRLGIGLVPEGRRCFGNLTVRENLLVAARGEAWDLARVFELFPVLRERAGQMAATLSGGEQQMLAIGRALMTSPRLLILDEATEGLAPLVRAQIWEAVERLKAAGLAILLVDKSLAEMRGVMDRAVILERGKSVWQGVPGEISEDVAGRYLGV